VNVQFTLIFLAIIAVVAFIAKSILSRGDEPPTVDEIVSEILPFINDPAALHRTFVRDLRRRRIYGAGTITDITTTPKTVTIELRHRVYLEASGGVVERDVILELIFGRADAPDEADVDDYVEFTGIIIDMTARHGTPVLGVDPGELLYIGEEPSETPQSEEEDASDTTAGLH
jgi:hypothetical protein